jgi:hypothetical protein
MLRTESLYSCDFNKRSLLRLLGREAFAIVGDKILNYALDIAMRQWSANKVLGDKIENGDPLNFELGTECKLGCELPIRFGLPCKH